MADAWQQLAQAACEARQARDVARDVIARHRVVAVGHATAAHDAAAQHVDQRWREVLERWASLRGADQRHAFASLDRDTQVELLSATTLEGREH